MLFHSVIDTLRIHTVPDYLGSCWTRDKIKEHTPEFVKEIWQMEDGQIIFTCDGFPIYIQKSGDFDIQKLTYSGKSKRNCLTFHGAVATDGTFLYINGPYHSSTVFSKFEKIPEGHEFSIFKFQLKVDILYIVKKLSTHRF